jgi:hypothetical protein
VRESSRTIDHRETTFVRGSPNGGVVVGSRNTLVGSVGGKDVAFDPDSHVSQ